MRRIHTATMPALDFDPGRLFVTRDGDRGVVALADRHYSRGTLGAALFVGPGRKLVLRDAPATILFAWRHAEKREDGQFGHECTIFHNEGPRRSSDVILEAEAIVAREWGGARLFTYVNADAVLSPNPGYCFKCAGWRFVGCSLKRGLHLLVKEAAR